MTPPSQLGLMICVFLFIIDDRHFVSASPEIFSFDKVVELNEDEASNTQLSTIQCSDTDGDPTRVAIQNVSPTTPCTNCFGILDCGSDKCLEYRAGVGSLNYASAQTYLVTVACEDTKETPATEVIHVRIIPKLPPIFINPNQRLVDNPISSNTPPGTVIYDVNTKDEAQNDVTYSMQVVLASAAFGFTINEKTGEISSAVDLRSVCMPHVTFLVQARNSAGTSGPVVINSLIQDANIAPVAMNLDTEVQIPESKTGKVFTMEFIDELSPTQLTYKYTTTNAAGFAQYTFNSNEIRATNLNYEDESLRQTYMTVTASDGYCESPEYFLRLNVMDVNEPPIVSPTTSTVTVCEGESEHDPLLTVTDEDTKDTSKWYFQTPSFRGRFDIDQDTGFLRTTMDYDVDRFSYTGTGNLQGSASHTVVYEDKGGLTATATVTLSLLDCNDNSPFFDGLTKEHRGSFSASECSPAGTVVGRNDASDRDSQFQGNNVFTYSGGTGCCRVQDNGAIIVDSPLPAGNVVSFNVYATDEGQTPSPLTSVVPSYVSVVFTQCPTPTTATTAAPDTAIGPAPMSPQIDVTESFSNIPWIVVASLLGLAFLGLLAYMLWRFGSFCFKHPCFKLCKFKMRRVGVPKQSKIKQEPMRKPVSRPARSDSLAEPQTLTEDGQNLNPIFWKTNFREHEADALPNLSEKPAPGDLEDRVMDPLQD